MNEPAWFLFVLHLPSKESTARMRVWRGLRSAGAAILRDGVYLLPARPQARELFDEHAAAVGGAGGAAYVLSCQAGSTAEEQAFRALFDRSSEYAAWHREAADLGASLSGFTESQARRGETALQRSLESIVATDFFPGPPRETARQVSRDLAGAVTARFSPDEPSAATGAVLVRDRRQYRGRLWATRRRLWADRVASAWLIRRFVDPDARFRWLTSPQECPPDAVGFDFDGAEFSHRESKVTFEVLLQAFGLTTDPALVRLGSLVHFLDVGGAPVPEASGLVALLSGARERCADDGDFLEAASVLFEDLHTAFTIVKGVSNERG